MAASIAGPTETAPRARNPINPLIPPSGQANRHAWRRNVGACCGKGTNRRHLVNDRLPNPRLAPRVPLRRLNKDGVSGLGNRLRAHTDCLSPAHAALRIFCALRATVGAARTVPDSRTGARDNRDCRRRLYLAIKAQDKWMMRRPQRDSARELVAPRKPLAQEPAGG